MRTPFVGLLVIVAALAMLASVTAPSTRTDISCTMPNPADPGPADLHGATADTTAPDVTGPDDGGWRLSAVGRLGVSPGSGIFSRSDAELAADFRQMADMGATWVRLDFDWSGIEPEPGVWDWAAIDRVVDGAHRQGLSVLGLLTYTPDWARPPGTTDKHPPADPRDFARFAATVSQRFGRDRGAGDSDTEDRDNPETRGGTVRHWEIWNEPNTDAFWEPGPDPVTYAELVRQATAAIRAVDAAAFVMTGGLAPAENDPGTELSPEQFLGEMYAELGPGVVDAVALHPYSFPVNPTDPVCWNLFARLPAIAAQIEEAEGRPLPLWLTEFGAPFDPEAPNRQAEIVVEGLIVADQWPWAGPIFLYALNDAVSPSDEPPFGLLHPDGTHRPAWTAVRALVSS